MFLNNYVFMFCHGYICNMKSIGIFKITDEIIEKNSQKYSCYRKSIAIFKISEKIIETFSKEYIRYRKSIGIFKISDKIIRLFLLLYMFNVDNKLHIIIITQMWSNSLNISHHLHVCWYVCMYDVCVYFCILMYRITIFYILIEDQLSRFI